MTWPRDKKSAPVLALARYSVERGMNRKDIRVPLVHPD
jgi:hypothetical protein